ncbi:MAG: maleylacetoacetate isomerase [Dokdonella sp.]|jgi:maleylacetoacetate isomerase|uniref:maleylacetoacetate isomerase n=1 Tax=Dokdonella sp. TaxID=2291710 RepID=UPI0025BCA88D|nr:maleylacetoacetate isomerase [Dokdonella sp.]MBK8123138.1 maleylacetoacetate isomerase [Dokdonella sp.]HNV07965.1 maleylacetoacetate isomerase [Dokdonella sp.]HPW04729.1 maleylacetoacetate isomerase [Dokdonella sp.]HQX34591.1 maleylacetoacetate isomerase [Dokdonella sp.]
MAETLTLYSYWRSSAAYRVRIALNLKQLSYVTVPVHLLNNGGEQHADEYRELNPQESVPVLLDGARIFRQSMAIIEYLDEAYPGGASLLPSTARERARVRALAQTIACDIHPLNNLRVMQFLERDFSSPAVERERWSRHWITEGFRALQALLGDNSSMGLYCEGDSPTLADICLVPQVYNARRIGVDLAAYPDIVRIEQQCLALPAFEAARPENQPDAPATPV